MKRRRFGGHHLPADGRGQRGYVVVAHDVTEREQLDVERERLLAVQREVTQVLVEQNHRLRELTQMKDDVVATVSHELRTPLTSIRGFVELLLDGKSEGLDAEQIRMLTPSTAIRASSSGWPRTCWPTRAGVRVCG